MNLPTGLTRLQLREYLTEHFIKGDKILYNNALKIDVSLTEEDVDAHATILIQIEKKTQFKHLEIR